MKFYCFLAFLSLAAISTGCGTTHSVARTNGSSYSHTISIKDFLQLGRVVQTSKGIEVTITSDQLFLKKSSRLTKAGAAKVDSMAAAILKQPDLKVLVIGYTDNTGTDMKNVRFSENQATRVMVELVKQGILAANVNAVGNGPVEQVAPNDSAENKAKNSRIVFEINTY
jgi:outer membrane protein OmpA-like peptidoglycan-associated protein